MAVPARTLSAAHQAAEKRLGRPLTYAEGNIDIVGLDRDLAAGKQALYVAVEREKRRAINAFLRYGRSVRIDFTPAMLAALRKLYRAGVRHGLDEVEKATGRRPRRQYAQIDDDLAKMVRKLRRELHGLQRRVEHGVGEAHAAGLGIGDLTQIAATREVLQIPGAMSVAAEVTSGALFAGIGSVLDASAGLFTSWVYSAVMDNATCDACDELDGTEFESWEAIQEVLPDGGPNPGCYGEGRCRCRAVPGEVAPPLTAP